MVKIFNTKTYAAPLRSKSDNFIYKLASEFFLMMFAINSVFLVFDEREKNPSIGAGNGTSSQHNTSAPTQPLAISDSKDKRIIKKIDQVGMAKIMEEDRLTVHMKLDSSYLCYFFKNGVTHVKNLKDKAALIAYMKQLDYKSITARANGELKTSVAIDYFEMIQALNRSKGLSEDFPQGLSDSDH